LRRRWLGGLWKGAEKGRCHLRKENNGAQKRRENFLKNECLHANKEIAHNKELIVPRL
jgi:hypothetical protein